jgi:hypothetical protein
MSAGGYAPQPLGARVREAAATYGMRTVAREFARWGAGALAGVPWTLARSHGEFEFDGGRYRYLYHRYKLTWLTERAVEVPVVQAIVDRYAGKQVLEVGNVLSHYRPQRHLVLDRHEHAPGVLNRDVVESEGLGTFDLIISISTLEHVGWDERPREPGKAVKATETLRSLLAPGGLLVLTLPVGYNPSLDAAVRDGRIELSRCAALRRAGAGPRWHELPLADAWAVPYDFLLYRAGAVVFAFLERRRQ